MLDMIMINSITDFVREQRTADLNAVEIKVLTPLIYVVISDNLEGIPRSEHDVY